MSDEEKVYKPVRRARIPFTPKIVIVVLVILFLVAAWTRGSRPSC